jgi:hypothetical protein
VTDVVERYLLLGLRLGRHVDGLVDAYYGPPELAQAVAAAAVVEPQQLVADADCLAADLASSDLEPQRRGWLGDQVGGLRTYAGVLAGEQISYADEVERCYGVRPEPVSEDTYREVHARLDELLPGDGSLLDRYEGWRESRRVPSERMIPALAALVELLRVRTMGLIDLPAGEALVVEAVDDAPWWAFNYYEGELRSRVVINAAALTTPFDLVGLAAHEAYPGHHTEHAVKEQLLIRDRGFLEEAIQLVPTPQAVVGEGIAEIGLDLLLDEELEREIEDVLAEHGLEDDLGLALEVDRARRPIRGLGLDAALIIHEHGGTVEEAQAYVERWGLRAPAQAAQAVRFVTDPTWRAYAATYSAGQKLCGAYVGGDPGRFRTLLTEQVRVADLIAAQP